MDSPEKRENVKDKEKCIGRYRILLKLGEGGMGKVYKAYDTSLQRLVALKTILPKLNTDAETTQRFNREAKSMAKLRHPNIVTLYDFEEVKKLSFITMEFVQGESLEHILREGKLHFQKACGFIIQILDAIGYAHSQGILHRDIKPSNILIESGEKVFVTDFGLAKALSTTEATKISTPGAVMGSPAYMSPEQAKCLPENPLDTRSDIYSIGVVFYEMLAGRPPFVGDNVFSLMYRIINENVPSPRDSNPEIPLPLEKICMKALSKNKEERYQSATEMILDIKGFLSQTGNAVDSQSATLLNVEPVQKDKSGTPCVLSKDLMQTKSSTTHKMASSKSFLIVAGMVVVFVLGAKIFDVGKKIKRADRKTPEIVKEKDDATPDKAGEVSKSDAKQDNSSNVNDNPSKENEKNTGDQESETDRDEIKKSINNIMEALRNRQRKEFLDLCSNEYKTQDFPQNEDMLNLVMSWMKHTGENWTSGEDLNILKDAKPKAAIFYMHYKTQKKYKSSHYMVYEDNKWKYDGDEIYQKIRSKNLKPADDKDYHEASSALYSFSRAKTSDKDSYYSKEFKRHFNKKKFLSNHLPKILKVLYEKEQGANIKWYLTDDPKILVFAFKYNFTLKDIRLVMILENDSWKIHDIR